MIFRTFCRSFVLPHDISVWVAFSGSTPSLWLYSLPATELCEAERPAEASRFDRPASDTGDRGKSGIPESALDATDLGEPKVYLCSFRSCSPFGDEYGDRILNSLERGSGDRYDLFTCCAACGLPPNAIELLGVSW
uniref:(northern house mosquito) hypothetical protein n=1 Tax=Culex pipiens TaxID=7175 RepID=A0A8D8LE11_CULPI